MKTQILEKTSYKIILQPEHAEDISYAESNI